MTVLPLPPRGEWLGDARDSGRALRVSWHEGDEGPFAVLSTWRGDVCVATTRLSGAEVARLIGVLADGLASSASGLAPAAASRDVESA